MSYQNIKAEMTRRRVTQECMASYLGMSQQNLGLKLNGQVRVSIGEALAVKQKFFPELPLEYLFEPFTDSKNDEKEASR